jgi:aldehyde dehydrogenase (NAD+)
MTLTKNFINGRWVESVSRQTFDNINPATGVSLGKCALSGAADVDAAVRAAKDAFKKWRLVPAPKRGEILFRAAEILRERKEHIARVITQEMGKVLVEARGDVQEAIDMAYYMAGEGRRSFGQTVPAELPNKFAMSVRDPIGVVALITPWNFPVAIPSWKSLPALVLGNTVVFKPSDQTPLCAAEYVRALADAGLPAGALNLVLGSGREVGEALVHHPDVAMISFTGSNEVGTRIATECARQNKRCTLEMGGKNAITVLEDADLDLAVDGIVWSAFGTSGQRCTAASRVLVHKKVRKELTARLVERVKKLRVGNGLDEKIDVGPVVNAAALEKIHRYVEIGVKEGARLLCGGQILHRRGAEDAEKSRKKNSSSATSAPLRLNKSADLSKGFFYAPTLFDNVTPAMRIAQEEIFGPVTCLIEIGSLDEAIAVNNGVKYGLSSSIYTRDVNRAFRAMRDLTTGIVYVNAGTIGAEIQLPFGGTRGTGNGHREAGTAALDTFSEWKSIYVDYSGKLQRAQIDSGNATG